jgi:hypothetical protein
MGLFFIDPEKIRQFFFKHKAVAAVSEPEPALITTQKKMALYAIGIYILIQVILPMRWAFYPGNVFWTEEGYRMSWKMMLRKKTGTIHFKIVDPDSKKTWIHNPAEKFTASHVQWIAICPDIAWQYAQHLKKEYQNMGYAGVAVYAIDSVSLNKNPPQLLIDTSVNLAAIKWHPFSHSAWILPYQKQLK